MGIDAGFDMVPRLSQDTGVKEMCQGFITMVKTIYSADDNVDFKQHFIQFNAGKHPLLPYDGHKFLRFSSKSPEGLLRKPMRSTTSGSLSTLPGSILVPAFDLVGVPWDRHGARVASKTGPRSTTQSEATAWVRIPPRLPRPFRILPLTNSADRRVQDSSHDDHSGHAPFRHPANPTSAKGRGLVPRVNSPEGARILQDKPWSRLPSPRSQRCWSTSSPRSGHYPRINSGSAFFLNNDNHLSRQP